MGVVRTICLVMGSNCYVENVGSADLCRDDAACIYVKCLLKLISGPDQQLL